MKKMIAFAVLGLMLACSLTGCNSTDGPKSVAVKAMECLKNKDAKGYVELVEIPMQLSHGSDSVSVKDGIAKMVEELAIKKNDQHDGIKGFEIVSEHVDEANGTAEYQVKISFGDGTEQTTNINLKRFADGVWRIPFMS